MPIDRKVGILEVDECMPIYKEVKRLLNNSEGFNVIQIGSSSGRELFEFSKLFPNNFFLGADISEDILEYSKKYQKDNLRFVLCQAKNIGDLIEKCPNRRTILISSGCLSYVQPEHVDLIFDRIKSIANLTIIIFDAGNKGGLVEGSTWRGGFFSWTHNYKFYAEKDGRGIQTVAFTIIEPYDPKDKTQGNTIHLFFLGNTTVLD